MTVRFSQSHGIVPIEQTILDNWTAGGTLDSINMALYNHCTIIFIGGADVATNAVLTISGGTADGGIDASINFSYRYATGDIDTTNADVLGSIGTSSALTVVAADLANAMLVIEIDASDLLISGTQYNFITCVLSSAGSDGEYTAVAILSEPRYEEAVMPSAVVA